MNKKTLRIAEEILRTAEDLIFADSDYIYDPDHNKKPSGGYHKTEKGWSKKEEKKDKSTSSSKVEMTDEQKKLDEMANNENYGIRKNVAKNPNTSPETLDKLSNDEYYEVRVNVAEHPNTSPKTLDKLSNDEYWDVRVNVASNPSTSPQTLEKFLSGDDVSWTIENIVENPSTPDSLLKKIAKNDFPSYSNEWAAGMAKIILKYRKKEKTKKELLNYGFDLSKLSPELREKVKDWDAEDIKKFIGWLKEHKG